MSDKIADKLSQYAPPTPSRWREEAEFRLTNRKWLRYSQDIAMEVLDRMEELGLSAEDLAQELGCSEQTVSKILQGRENLTLETISKIETALQLNIMHFND